MRETDDCKLIKSRELINRISRSSLTSMPSKRRNHGRSKKNRGHVKPIVCGNCGRLVAKDKAIKRYTVKDIVDSSSKKDIRDNVAFTDSYTIPKLFYKQQWCVSCAIHSRVVRVRSSEDRKVRAPPVRIRRDIKKTKPQAPAQK